jgi:hypothetical protein
MTDLQVGTSMTMDDDDIRAMFDRRAARGDSAGLVDAVMSRVAATDQHGAWRGRIPTVRSAWPLATRLALLAMIVIALVSALMMGIAAPRPANVPPDWPTGRVDDLPRPFEYALPPGSALQPYSDRMVEWISAAAPGSPSESDPPYAQAVSRGVVIATAETAWSHGNGRVRLRTTPAALLEDLRGRTRLPLAASSTTVDGRPALTAMADPPGANDLHFTRSMEGLVGGTAYVIFTYPARITLVDIDGSTVVLLTWARSSADLAAFLPVADGFIDTIHFVDPAHAGSSTG